ncbi:helix-turn-helix domain-containing protein [Campylobacter sp. MIT 97-5078]|uniref:helix-turn-helix domain-containing protein n=1 Tax=Campylobacter sp. MIT 97-5078 TaxID=1548153 RepID=UPI000A98AB7F|nr:helix-turn-helix domain-containing protein [Campylobacter sp. MIT 97-5078]
MSISCLQTKSFLTQEQQAVVDFNIDDILIVNAYPGTRKTSTLVQFHGARKDFKILYLSYNSSMRKEAEVKFKHLKNVEVKTMRSLAYVELEVQKKYKERLESLRAIDLFSFVEDLKEDIRSFYATAILKTIRYFCNTNLEFKSFLAEISKDPSKEDGSFKEQAAYYSVDEVAKMHSVTHIIVCLWIVRGILKGVKLGKGFYMSREAILDFQKTDGLT